MPGRSDALLPLEIDILVSGFELQSVEGFYGFQLAKHLRAGRGDSALTAHGTLYKALSRLMARGLLEAWWEDPAVAEQEGRPRRRMYRLSGTGELAVRQELEKPQTRIEVRVVAPRKAKPV